MVEKSVFAFLTQGFRRAVAVLLLGVMASLTCVQADEAFELHQARPSETVASVVLTYLQGPGALAALVHLNGWTHPEQVIAGRIIKLPRSHLKFQPSQARITRLNCNTVVRTDVTPAVALEMGAILHEGAVLRIPTGCQLVLTLEDDTSLRMLSGATVKLKTLRQRLFSRTPDVQVELLDGRISVDVPRQRRASSERLEVYTPMSVAGVRGTEFRVAFGADDGVSAVEVQGGSVGARGLTEVQEQKVAGGQGMVISATGQSLPVESLLPPLRFSGVSQGLASFQGESSARHFVLTTAQDALFMEGLGDQRRQTASVFPTGGVTDLATFVRWGAVSVSGLVGELSDFGLCQGVKLQNVWRCDIAFNFSGWVRPRLQLERLTDQGGRLLLVDRSIDTGHRPSWLFRNLPAGHYRWRIEELSNADRITRSTGKFQLIAVRSPD